MSNKLEGSQVDFQKYSHFKSDPATEPLGVDCRLNKQGVCQVAAHYFTPDPDEAGPEPKNPVINFAVLNDVFIKQLNMLRAITGILTREERKHATNQLRNRLGLPAFTDEEYADQIGLSDVAVSINLAKYAEGKRDSK